MSKSNPDIIVAALQVARTALGETRDKAHILDLPQYDRYTVAIQLAEEQATTLVKIRTALKDLEIDPKNNSLASTIISAITKRDSEIASLKGN